MYICVNDTEFKFLSLLRCLSPSHLLAHWLLRDINLLTIACVSGSAENQVNSPCDLILSGFCPLVIVRSDFSLGGNEAGTPKSEAIPSE